MIAPRSAKLAAPPLALPAALTPVSAARAAVRPGTATLAQGTQSNAAYAASLAAAHATNIDATSGQLSCYRPEVPNPVSDGPADGCTGMSACSLSAATGEDTGAAPYPTQAGSNPGYPATSPMLVKDHPESGIRVDPASPRHLIGSSLPPYGAANYCVNASIQFCTPQLLPPGHNIRLSGSTFDPRLNSPHTGCATCETTFAGGYFGNTAGAEPAGPVDYASFSPACDDATNPAHCQQQIAATIRVP